MIKKTLFIAFILNAVLSLTAKAQTSFAPLAERLMPSVVNISTRQQEEKDTPDVENDLLFTSPDGRSALGSGFAVSQDGYIATNYHVIADAQKISVVTFDNSVYEAKVIGFDTKTDIALIKISPNNPMQPVEFGDSDKARVGDWVLAIGNPFGLGSSVTAGIISAKSRDIDSGPYDDYLQTDASINQGNSGGPMFDMEGKLVGINTAIFSTIGNSVGVGFALPSNQAKWVIEELKDKGKVERGWLGISVKQTQIQSGISGLAVVSFADDKTALRSNLRIGDVIVSLNGTPVNSAKTFSLLVSKQHQSAKVKLKIWRNGTPQEIEEVVGIMPAETSETSKVSEKENALSFKEGKFYPSLGFYMDGLQVVKVMPESEAASKGVQKGDVLKKINGNMVYVLEELDRQNADALLGKEPLRLEFESADSKDTYFVEILPQL